MDDQLITCHTLFFHVYINFSPLSRQIYLYEIKRDDLRMVAQFNTIIFEEF